VGQQATGSATISPNNSPHPTGTVTYTVYTDSSCSTQYTATNNPSQVNIPSNAGGIPPSSAAITFSQAGTFYWQAVYGGDSKYNGSSSSCVSLTVSKATPTLSLTLSTSSAVAATGVTGTATLSGGFSPTGTVTFAVYSDSGCTTQVVPNMTSTKSVSGNGNVTSDSLKFNQVGTFYWNAVYSGDTNNQTKTSTCVQLTVTKANPSVTLSVAPSPATAGGTATGSATLTNATSNASGTATYTVYSDSACSTQLTATNNPSNVTVSAGAIPNSAAITINQAGTVYWQVSYGGDSNNNTAKSSCVALTVNKATPTVGLTVAPNPVTAGSTATGTATLTGATTTAGGQVVYTVYTDSGCTAQASLTGNPSTKNVTNGSAAQSDPITFSQAGTFYWKAHYTGDANNAAADSSCVSLTVNGSTVTLTINNGNTTPINLGSVDPGNSNVVSGAVTVSVSGNTSNWTGSCWIDSASNQLGGTTLAWRIGSSGTFTQFASDATAGKGCFTTSPTTFDLQWTVPSGTAAGSVSATLSYQVTAN